MENTLVFKTKIGSIELKEQNAMLISCQFTKKKDYHVNNKFLNKCKKEILEYLDGSRKKFSVKLNPKGTAFQKKVWQGLQGISYGQTLSYKNMGEKFNIKGYRAIGNANGKNPICIIIPCHRVIAHDGTLGGYSGGLDKKEKLLKLEGISFN